MNLADLKAPFAPDRISWRVGSTNADKSKGMALAYIDARDVQDRLDEVCGVDGWQCRYVPMHDKKTVCEIGIRAPRPVGNEDHTNAFASEWIWKADGAGDSDVEAEKGALSDAFKRAAVKWGIGRYLYDLDSPWVELDTYEKNGQKFAKGIKAGEYAKLRALLASNAKAAPPALVQTPAPPPSNRTPEAYVEKVLTEIAGFTTIAHAMAFRDANAKAMIALDDKHPKLYEKVSGALAQKEMALKGRAA